MFTALPWLILFYHIRITRTLKLRAPGPGSNPVAYRLLSMGGPREHGHGYEIAVPTRYTMNEVFR